MMSSLRVDQAPPAIPFEGYALRSAFQPIYSFSHQRLIGHEALIRATDAAGGPVSPQALFAQYADPASLQRLDQACTVLHIDRYAQHCESAQWLFLNIDVGSFVVDDLRRSTLATTLIDATAAAGLRPGQVVIELLEAALPDVEHVEHLTEELKTAGFNFALDDFGAGHSNFDRVFRLDPHIVKLDRSVIARAALNPRVRRVMSQMIALLHECGTQVLIEGVETTDEAIIALDSDADLVQGYYFGRPQERMRRQSEPARKLEDLWVDCDTRCHREAQATAARTAPYRDALLKAARMLAAGHPIQAACETFVRLPEADLCYLLDRHGATAAPSVFHRNGAPHPTQADRFLPLLDVRGSRWSRRPYFRSALASPGVVQQTRPYPAMHGPMLTVTLSISLELHGEPFVLCGDKFWNSPIDHIGAPTHCLETASTA